MKLNFTKCCTMSQNSCCNDIKKLWIVVILLSIVMSIGIVGVPLMDNDAAHHAAIALQMTESGDYVTLHDVMYDVPYFDKPHLQFWLVGGSFALFGVGGFVYKLSSIFFILLSFISTFKLAQKLSDNKNAGLYSIVVLGSMVAFMLNSSVDIRMDAMLSGAVIFAIWQGVVCIGGKDDSTKFRIMPYIGLAIGLFMAMATKGLYGVVVTGFVLLSYMIGVGRLKWLFSWRFLVALALFGIALIPLLWAYYEQFGWDGVRFILYEQVLIRTGGGMGTAGASDPFFFLHTMLWVVLPWSGFMYWFVVRAFVKRKFDKIFWLTIPSSIAVIALLSFSSFKLPQYLNPIFPLIALFVANEILQLSIGSKTLKGVSIMQKIIVGLIVVATVAINYWAFAFESATLAVVIGIALAGVVFTLFVKWDTPHKIIFYPALATVVMWLALNINFYPQLLKLQAGNELAKICKTKNIGAKEVAAYRWNDYSASFDIHHGGLHRRVSKESLVDSVGIAEKYVMIDSKSYDSIKNDHYEVVKNWEIVDSLPDYRVTRLTGKFLNPATRPHVLSTSYLIDLKAIK